MSLPEPRFRLEYAGKDITRDIHRFLSSLTYVDRVDGSSDELTIALEDSEGLWHGPWYPRKGDKLRAWIGDQSGLLPCGSFEIDHLGFSGEPDTFTIRALAAGPGKAVRTNRSEAYEQQTLRQIAQAAASRNGLRVQGTVPDIRLERQTQENEPDLAFLARLAKDYGLAFSLRGDLLVFTSIYELEAASPILTLTRQDLQPSFEFEDTLVGTYASCEVSYHLPKTKRSERHVVTVKDGTITSGDTLRITGKRLENRQQAEAYAKAQLHAANSKARTGTLPLVEGDRRVVAGINFSLTGMGAFSGAWHVSESTHTIDRMGGHSTRAKVKGALT